MLAMLNCSFDMALSDRLPTVRLPIPPGPAAPGARQAIAALPPTIGPLTVALAPLASVPPLRTKLDAGFETVSVPPRTSVPALICSLPPLDMVVTAPRRFHVPAPLLMIESALTTWPWITPWPPPWSVSTFPWAATAVPPVNVHVAPLPPEASSAPSSAREITRLLLQLALPANISVPLVVALPSVTVPLATDDGRPNELATLFAPLGSSAIEAKANVPDFTVVVPV